MNKEGVMADIGSSEDAAGDMGSSAVVLSLLSSAANQAWMPGLSVPKRKPFNTGRRRTTLWWSMHNSDKLRMLATSCSF